jgi:undecaprenyl-diphosphatase
MGHFEAILFGLVQGATEYLPVSSSAHLLILPHLLGVKDPGLAFDVILHFGTLLATAAYFLKDWLTILKNPIPRKNQEGGMVHLSWLHLIVGTIPAVITGVLLNHWIQDHTRSLVVLWVTIPVFGLLLWWVDRVRPMTRSLKDSSLKDLFLIGCMQSLALVPGVSRSGSTITASRFLGFSRAESARISFLLSLPVTLGAIVYELRHWHELVDSVQGVTPLVLACLSAMIFGAFAIHVLIKWVSRTSYAVFAVYRVILAGLIAAFLGAGSINAD